MDAIDEALVTLERGGYIALPADYPRPNAEWDSLDDIENRGVPEHMALLLAHAFAVNAFAGSRNADPALKQAGYGIVINTEIESEVEMGSHMDNAETPQDEKYDMSTTRIASGKGG